MNRGQGLAANQDREFHGCLPGLAGPNGPRFVPDDWPGIRRKNKCEGPSFSACSLTEHFSRSRLCSTILGAAPYRQSTCRQLRRRYAGYSIFIFPSSLFTSSFVHTQLFFGFKLTMGNSTSVAVHDCLVNAVGGNEALLASADDPLYQISDVRPYNLDIPVTPAAVTYPETAAHVAGIVKCAAEAQLKVQARSGGHSYGNYCMKIWTRITLIPSKWVPNTIV